MDFESNTMQEFLSKHNLTKEIAKKIIANLYDKKNPEMTLNVTQLGFLFDSRYPDISLSFAQMENVVNDFLIGRK